MRLGFLQVWQGGETPRAFFGKGGATKNGNFHAFLAKRISLSLRVVFESAVAVWCEVQEPHIGFYGAHFKKV